MSTTKTKTVFVDLDPVRYRVGFAAETNSYEVYLENEVTGQIIRKLFERTTDKSADAVMKEFLAEQKAWQLIEKVKHTEVEPWPYVQEILRAQMDGIKKEIRERFRVDRRDITIVPVLSGKGNYRDKLATLKPYKGNRDPAHKPQHYAALTDELINQYEAEVINGREADDEISIRAWDLLRQGRTDFVVATIDKDLDQIPGDHYDYMKKVHYEVDRLEAESWFWRQILSGDATDNIGGACKIGPKKAADLVESMDFSDPESCWITVLETYEKAAETPGCYHAQAEAYHAAVENARLVYLQRRPGELWTPPGEPKEYLE